MSVTLREKKKFYNELRCDRRFFYMLAPSVARHPTYGLWFMSSWTAGQAGDSLRCQHESKRLFLPVDAGFYTAVLPRRGGGSGKARKRKIHPKRHRFPRLEIND